MLWFGRQWSGTGNGERNGAEVLGVVFYTVKMYLACVACGLMLKKKLLPLMIKLVVILNNLGVIHL